jgi:hypothetical protein
MKIRKKRSKKGRKEYNDGRYEGEITEDGRREG